MRYWLLTLAIVALFSLNGCVTGGGYYYVYRYEKYHPPTGYWFECREAPLYYSRGYSSSYGSYRSYWSPRHTHGRRCW